MSVRVLGPYLRGTMATEFPCAAESSEASFSLNFRGLLQVASVPVTVVYTCVSDTVVQATLDFEGTYEDSGSIWPAVLPELVGGAGSLAIKGSGKYTGPKDLTTNYEGEGWVFYGAVTAQHKDGEPVVYTFDMRDKTFGEAAKEESASIGGKISATVFSRENTCEEIEGDYFVGTVVVEDLAGAHLEFAASGWKYCGDMAKTLGTFLMTGGADWVRFALPALLLFCFYDFAAPERRKPHHRDMPVQSHQVKLFTFKAVYFHRRFGFYMPTVTPYPRANMWIDKGTELHMEILTVDVKGVFPEWYSAYALSTDITFAQMGFEVGFAEYMKTA